MITLIFVPSVGNGFIHSASGKRNKVIFPEAQRINAFPTDGENTRAFLGYNVYRDGVLITNTNDLTYLDETTVMDNQYTYGVTALYSSGESEAVETTILVPAFTPPSNLTATAEIGSIILNWESPDQVFGTLSGYVIYRNGAFLQPISNVYNSFTDHTVENGIEYTYYLTAIYTNPDGISVPSNEATVTLVSIIDEPAIPLVNALLGNYPNPFNPETIILFDIAVGSNLRIDIYNTKGQRVITLIDKFMETGHHQAIWTGKDEHGKEQASGLYFYLMEIGETRFIKRMTLMK